MQPIAPYHPPDPLPDPSPPGPPPDPPAASGPDSRDPSLALGPDPGFRLASLIARAGAVAAVRLQRRDPVMQMGLDAFYRAMKPSFDTAEGKIAVEVPFAMNPRYRNQHVTPQMAADVHAAAARNGLGERDIARLVAGRGTPEAIQFVTQALINEGHLSTDSTVPLGNRVRMMMFTYGLGIDCSGYTQQAYLKGADATRASAGFDREIMNESLAGLGNRGFVRVMDLRRVRPGDIGVLAPPTPGSVGHRVVVYDQHRATVDDIRALLSFNGPAAFVVGGPILVFTVDSSWGCGDGDGNGHPNLGGVCRSTWWYNESSHTWAWTWDAKEAAGQIQTGPLVYGHPLEGFYRHRHRNPASATEVAP